MDLTSSVQSQSLRQIAYNKLREMILSGELKQEEPLIEKKLIERLQVGRTPLREAIQQLRQEDTLEVIPRSGTFVRPVDTEEIVAVFQARLVMEPEVARIAADKADRTILIKLRQIIEDDRDPDIMIRRDIDFHRFLYHSTRNRYLIRAMDVVCFQDQRIRTMSIHALEDLSETRREHLAVIDHILENDAEKAAQAMRAHIAHALETALEMALKK